MMTGNYNSTKRRKKSSQQAEQKPDLPSKSKTYEVKPTAKKDDNDASRDNRKSGQATRTLKACESCRKQKVRCINYDNSQVCVRCSYLDIRCSFEMASTNMSPSSSNANSVAAGDPDIHSKLDSIYASVNELLKISRSSASNPAQSEAISGHSSIHNHDARLLLEAASSMQQSSIPGTPRGICAPIPTSVPSSQIMAGKAYRFPSPKLYNAPTQSNSPVQRNRTPGTSVSDDMPPSIHSSAESHNISPFSLIHNQNKSDLTLIPRPILNLLNLSTAHKHKSNVYQTPDIISLGLISTIEAIDLMDGFRRNYGRWVSFPSSVPSGVLIERIRSKCSILLTACCLLSLRYSLNRNTGTPKSGPQSSDKTGYNDQYEEEEERERTFYLLSRQLVSELNRSLLKYSCSHGPQRGHGDIEFLQALVILSIYSLSLSSVASGINIQDELDMEFDIADLNLDAWSLSGLGLTTFVTKSTFGLLFRDKNKANLSTSIDPPSHEGASDSAIMDQLQLSPFTILCDELDDDEYQTLTIMRIYNHLILVHLINCIFSGRMCVVDEIRLNYCTATLSLPSSTNFDGRMVAEIEILLITYNYIQVNTNGGVGKPLAEATANFSMVKEEFKTWFEQWEYLFSQPALQFVELCYDFCVLMAYYSYSYQVASSKFASKSAVQLFDEDKIDFVLANCDSQTTAKIIQHASHLINFVNVIENNSYFAYLSDQIHFCFYFSAMVLIKSLGHLQKHGMVRLLDDIDLQDAEPRTDMTVWQRMLESVHKLVEKFGLIGGSNEDDILNKYSIGLIGCLEGLNKM